MADMLVFLRSCSLLCLLLHTGPALAHSPLPSSTDANLKTEIYRLENTLELPAIENRLGAESKIPIIARQEDGRGRGHDMTREQRRKRFEAMPPEQRQRIKERRQRFDSLPPEERQRLREARKKFRQLPEEERKKLKQKWRNLSPQEREQAREKRRKG